MKNLFKIIFLIFLTTSVAKAAYEVATITPTTYKVTVEKVELCETGSTQALCLNPVVLGTGSQVMDIAAVDVGATAGSYGNPAKMIPGTTYTYIQTTLNRAMTMSADAILRTGRVCATGGGSSSAGSKSAFANGQGSTSDITLKNDADETVFTVPTGTDDILFPDNAKIMLGTGSDLQLYHDGTDSIIIADNTSTLKIRNTSGNVELQPKTGEVGVKAIADGATELYHNNVKKIETTANGVTVSGTAIATTDTDTSNTGNVTLDFAANQNFVLTLTGNTTLVNPTTEQVGQSGFITCIQDGTGSRTLALGTDYETAGGAGITLSTAASATDLIPYVVVASNRILLGQPQKSFS